MFSRRNYKKYVNEKLIGWIFVVRGSRLLAISHWQLAELSQQPIAILIKPQFFLQNYKVHFIPIVILLPLQYSNLQERNETFHYHIAD